MHARQLLERVLDERVIGLDAELPTEQRRELRDRTLAVTVLPDDARRAIEGMRFLPVLVVDDRLVADPVGEKSTSS
jgi:hypothetical protein